MAVNLDNYLRLKNELGPAVTLVAVSKFKPAADIKRLYDEGHRDFGENYVQELVEKQATLPADIHWHFIGHLQSNKVKFIAPFVHLIQGVDSGKLLREINKQGVKCNRVIPVLLQIYIASEETKFGLNDAELDELLTEISSNPDQWKGVCITGLMGMASFSENPGLVKKEFLHLKSLYDKYSILSGEGINMRSLSMGMSNDYTLAVSCGSNMVRVGSLLFGAR